MEREADVTADDNPRVFLPPPLIFAALLTLGLVLDSNPVKLREVQFIGTAMVVGGLALIGTALGLFHRSQTRPEPWQPASSLVIRGIYRFTRNPMYLGMAMLSLGVAFVFTSWIGALMVLIAAVLIDHFVIRREEAYLTRRFGQEYVSYCQRVRRWF